MGAVLQRYFVLPEAWEPVARRLLAEPPALHDAAGERERLERALRRLQELHTWGDVAKEEYRQRRTAVERELRSLKPPPPTRLAGLRRSAALLRNLGKWWQAKELSDATRKEMVDEMFESIAIDELGVREVTPRGDYLIPAATAVVVVGSGRGERTFPADNHHPPLRPPQLVTVSGIQPMVARLLNDGAA